VSSDLHLINRNAEMKMAAIKSTILVLSIILRFNGHGLRNFRSLQKYRLVCGVTDVPIDIIVFLFIKALYFHP
jgi:hypothetical protein